MLSNLKRDKEKELTVKSFVKYLIVDSVKTLVVTYATEKIKQKFGIEINIDDEEEY